MHARMLTVVLFSEELSTEYLLPHASRPMDGHVAMDRCLLRGIRSLARQQAKELRIREVRICTGTIGIVSVDLAVTRCH